MRKLLSSFSTISRISTVVNNQFHNPFIRHVPNQFHNPFIHHVPNIFYCVDPNQDPKPGYETVPCTKLIPTITITFEKDKGVKGFEELKQAYERKILPPTHPDSVRVTNILNNIIHGFNNISHPELEDCTIYSGGKIVVTTTFMEHYPSDVEIATLIAHQVVHIVAHHSAEKFTKKLWVYALDVVLNQFVTIDFTKRVKPFVDRLPFNRRIEMEADYIGLLLMGSAGYDPRLTPKVYENAMFAADVFSTHPPGRKRAEALARPEIMEEALILYNDVSARHGVE